MNLKCKTMLQGVATPTTMSTYSTSTKHVPKMHWVVFATSVTRFGTFFYQIRLDALRQHPLVYIIATFTTGGGSPTSSKQLW